MKTQLWSVILVLIGTVIGSFAPIFLKKGAEKNFSKLSYILKNYDLMWGIIFFGAGTILFIPALKGGDLSVLYPLVSLNYVFVALFSRKFLGEKMNKFKWLGILMIIIGVTFIGFGR